MELLPLKLTAKRGNWQLFMSRKANKAFLNVRDRVFARDDFTCRYCGFQAKQYQEVVNIDHNYQNNHLENMVTACSFCSQCFFIDALGLDGKTGATLIYLPEIGQADLNHFCRTLFCSMLRDAPYKGKLQAAYLSLLDRGKVIEEVFGPHSKEPIVFGQALVDSGLTDAHYNHPVFADLKLLPIRKYFKTQAEYWKSTVFTNIPL